MDAERKHETVKIEEKKNLHIARLMKIHEKAFAEIKNYYHDITHNNLDLIRSLKEEVRFVRSVCGVIARGGVDIPTSF